MTAAMEFEAKPTRHECFSAKSMVRPKSVVRHAPIHYRSDHSDSCSARGFSAFRYLIPKDRSITPSSLVPHAVQAGDCLSDRTVDLRGFAAHTSLLQGSLRLCLNIACFSIPQDAGRASYP
jgi:hypothetical protein